MPQRRNIRGRHPAAPSIRRKLGIARRVLGRWGQKNFARYPWRFEENRFHALVAEILLQRTRAEQVVSTFELFKREFPRPSDLASASEARVAQIVRPLGLRWRAKFLLLLGKELAGRKQIPSTLGDLMSLPGVGPYAASAYLSFHRGERGVLLDSNIVRFYGRLFGIPAGPESRRSRVFKDIAETATPATGSRDFNYALLDFTRGICRAQPACPVCPLQRICCFFQREGGKV